MKLKKISLFIVFIFTVIFLQNLFTTHVSAQSSRVYVTLMITAFDPAGTKSMVVSNSGDFSTNISDDNKGNDDDAKVVSFTPVHGQSYVNIQNWRLATGEWGKDNNNNITWDTSSKTRKVYIKFIDAAGNELICLQTIDIRGSDVLDYAQINGGAFYTNNPKVTINFKGADGYSNLQLTNDAAMNWIIPPTPSGSTTNYSSSDWNFSDTLTSGEGNNYINLKADEETTASGIMLVTNTLSIMLDETPPEIKNVSILSQPFAGSCVVSANFSDATSGIGEKFYAPGNQDVSYFSSGKGTGFSSDFTVTTSGAYTMCAEDNAGNYAIKTFNVKAITSAAAIQDINVANGTTSGSIGLPETVNITLSDNTTTSAAVTWDGGSPSYNGNSGGDYIFTGTIIPANGVINQNNVRAVVKVIVPMTSPAAFTVNTPTSEDNGVNDDGKSRVKVTWTDSTTTTVDHYEIVAKKGSAPGVSDIVSGKTSIAPGTGTASFDWNSGEDVYVGVVAVDKNGLKTLCSGTKSDVTVAADVREYSTGEAFIEKSNITAGAAVKVTFTVKDSKGNISDMSGIHKVRISGYTVAPDGRSYGEFNGTKLSSGYADIDMNFSSGTTTASIKLNAAGEQDICFSIDGVDIPATNSVSVNVSTAAAITMDPIQDIESPLSNGGKFEQQPEIKLLDAYGNPCTNDNSTVITAAKKDNGNWTLTGTTTAQAVSGIALFNNLGTESNEAVTGAQIEFTSSIPGSIPLGSSQVNIPAPPNSTINPGTGSFDKNVSKQAAVSTTLSLNGNTLKSITNGNYNLVSGTDYTTTGSAIVISKDYLEKQSAGTTTLTFNFSAGDTQTLAITVTDTTPSPTTSSAIVEDDTGNVIKQIPISIIPESDGTKTVELKSQDAVALKAPDGTVNSLADSSKLSFSSTAAAIAADGTISIKNLANGSKSKIDIAYDLGNGQKIIIGTMEANVSTSGAVSLTSTLIDPYGKITDSTTGGAISGADVTLYYSNTDRNKKAGITPDTVVKLPAINGFKPNNNSNPQTSDSSGSYGYMVFPNTDYYIVAVKDGYDKYISPAISVENQIVKHDFTMKKTVSYNGGGSSGDSASNTTIPKNTVQRISGQNRVDTALAIAEAVYKDKVSNVVIASSENYPDALSGSVLANKLKAPILLVGNNESDEEKIILYLKSSMNSQGTVYILGGNGSVSSYIETKISEAGFKNVSRIGGTDRYETTAKIAEADEVKQGTPVIIVSGENYPDAISVSSIAAIKQYPILMINKDEIPEAVTKEISKIKPDKVYIIGLQGAVSTEVENQLAQIAAINKTNVVRIGGNDRFKTSLEAAKYFNLSGDSACISTGNDYPDALAGSSYAANNNAPIILLGNSLTDDEKTYLQNLKLKGITIFGGTGVVTTEEQDEISKLINK